jgi:hypothetical protein
LLHTRLPELTRVCHELRMTGFTGSERRDATDSLQDPKSALCHISVSHSSRNCATLALTKLKLRRSLNQETEQIREMDLRQMDQPTRKTCSKETTIRIPSVRGPACGAHADPNYTPAR